MFRDNGVLSVVSAPAEEEDVFDKLDRLADNESGFSLELDVNDLIPELRQDIGVAPDCFWTQLNDLETQTPVIPPAQPVVPSTKRKAIDADNSFTTLSIFSSKNKRANVEVTNACPSIYAAVMQKLTIIKGTTTQPFFEVLEKQWLKGEIIKLNGEPSRITKAELKNIFVSMHKNKEQSLINELWKNNTLLLKDILTEMDIDELELVFADLRKLNIKADLKKYIWECKGFAAHVLKKNAAVLHEIFLDILVHRPVVITILESIWKNKTVRVSLLNRQDRTTYLLNHLMSLPITMINEFLAPGRSLYNLIRKMPEVDAAKRILDYGTRLGRSAEKIMLVVNLIDQASVLEKVMSDMGSTRTAYNSYFKRCLEERLDSIKKPAMRTAN